MDINNIIPNSPNDIGVLVFWVIFIILILSAIILYVYYRKLTKKVVKTQEIPETNPKPTEQMEKPIDEGAQKTEEIKSETDKTIDEEKIKYK